MTNTLTYNRAKEVFDYDPDTGEIRWKLNIGAKAKAGELAGTYDKDGYRLVGLDGKHVPASRLIVLLMTGEFPKGYVSYNDGDSTNLRWSNIRLCQRTSPLRDQLKISLSKNGETLLRGYFATPNKLCNAIKRATA